MNFRKVDWEGYTAESENKFANTPLPTSCSAEEKVFRQILSNAGRHHIPCGYVRDYSRPLPEVVRPLISERDQRRTDDPLNPAIKLLDRDRQQHIRQDAEDQWRSLRECSYRTTYAKRYWSWRQEVVSPTEYFNRLQWKNPFQHEGNPTSLQQAVHCLLYPTRSAIRRNLHLNHRVDPTCRPFDERGIIAAIRKAGSSIAQGSNGLTMLFPAT